MDDPHVIFDAHECLFVCNCTHCQQGYAKNDFDYVDYIDMDETLLPVDPDGDLGNVVKNIEKLKSIKSNRQNALNGWKSSDSHFTKEEAHRVKSVIAPIANADRYHVMSVANLLMAEVT